MSTAPQVLPDAHSEAVMLGYAYAQVGDICYRPDVDRTYRLTALPPSTLANWQVQAVAPNPLPILNSWVDRVIEVGGGVADWKKDAVLTALTSLRDADLLDSLVYFLVYNAADGFDGCNVPIIDAGYGPATLHNFNSEDWGYTGLNCEGTKWVDTLFVPSEKLSNTNDRTVFQWTRNPTDYVSFGCLYNYSFINNGFYSYYNQSGTSFSASVGNADAYFDTPVYDSDGGGLTTLTRTALNEAAIYQNDSPLTSTALPNHQQSYPLELISMASGAYREFNENFPINAQNIQGGGRLSQFGVLDKGLMEEEVSALYSILNTLRLYLED